MNLKKRLLSLVLALATLVSIIPGNLIVFANDIATISVSEMEVGKLYKAGFIYGDAYLRDKDGNLYMEYGKETTVDVTQDGFPTDLIVMLENAGDPYVRIMNEDWPAEYDLYRYTNEEDLYIYEKIEDEPEVPTLGVTCNGAPVEEIALFEDGKMPLAAELPEGVTEAVEWSWEILVDPATDLWVAIGDKTSAICEVSYALVVNVLDDNGEAKVRAMAKSGDTEYVSKPITVKMKYAPKPMEQVFETPSTASAPANDILWAASADEIGFADAYGVATLAEDTIDQITIKVNFIRVRPDGTREEAAYPDIRTLKVGYEEYTVKLPAVLGYYPSEIAPDQLTDKNGDGKIDYHDFPDKIDLTTYLVKADYTSDQTFNVYYYPGEAGFTVYHYKQNVYDDGYSLYKTVTDEKGIVATAVPDNIVLNPKDDDGIKGHRHLYFEHAEIAADGSTVIEIYYDREYYTVLFDMVQLGAYGQENLYVKYETEVGLSDPQCAGWTFSSWEKAVTDANGNTSYESTNYTAGKTNLHKVEANVTFRAVWNGAPTSYSVVYWLENPNDGNYSVWFTQDELKYVTTDNKNSIATSAGTGIKEAISGGFVKWDEVVPDELKTGENANIYPFVSLNTTKTKADWNDPNNGVLLEGDKSTTVDVYFNRRTYNISFETSVVLKDEYKHNCTDIADPCQYNLMYCTDPSHSNHVHTDACGVINCEIEEHKHTADCCSAHMHEMGCYANVQPLTTLGEEIKEQILDDIAENHWLVSLASFFGVDAKTWFKNQLNNSSGDPLATAASTQLNNIVTMSPPQNLQNGFVYVQNSAPIEFDFQYKDPIKFWTDKKETDHYSGVVSYSVIFIDNGNDVLTDDWYYYNEPEGTNSKTGDVLKAKCGNDDHDHTSGCVYGVKCTKNEHVHNSSCYNACSDKSAPQHTAACYGNVCMAPQSNKDNDNNTKTVINLQAKFGQDITEYLPYYLELSDYDLHKDGNKNFVSWKYAGTGWADEGDEHFIKHVTMVDTLCYSRGVTATARYEETYDTPYLLYYLFESFDTKTGEDSFKADGSGRYHYGDKWYDSDPAHMQLIMWNSENVAPTDITGYDKTIAGMSETVVGLTEQKEQITVSGNTVKTQFGYFYDRKIECRVIFHNDGEEILTVPAVGQPNPLKYGLPLGELANALLNLEVYGKFDINNVPYPDSLEKNAYVFDGWYTTPQTSEYTKVDWGIDTLPEGDLNLYAHWKPIIRNVYVYQDVSLRLPFDLEDNYGYQQVGHRSYAIEPDYKKSQYYNRGYTFDGWFYADPKTGEETAFLFNFPIVEDGLKIYAKWHLDQVVFYRINYAFRDKNGVVHEIAASVNGTGVIGQNKTFRAATGTALYTDYQEGFFPQIGSHTVQMVYDENNPDAINEFTFYYDEVEKVKYWVKYVDADTNEELLAPQEYETRKMAITERFLPVAGYTVDEYAKSLILSSQDQETNNVITFYYTENEVEEGKITVTAPWVVNHMIQNADGTYSVYRQETGIGEYTYKKGETPDPPIFFGTVRTDITKYTFTKAVGKTRRLNGNVIEDVEIPEENLINISQSGDNKYGYALNEYGIEIDLYYDRDRVGYKVQYKAADTDEVFYSYDVAADSSVPHGDDVTVTLDQQKHMEIVYNEGYQLVDDTQTSIIMTLYIDESRNVITFLYQKFDATFEYQILCDDLENSGVGLSMTREVIGAGSDDSLQGAFPYESATYYFAGWYADAGCTQPIDTITIENYSATLDLDPYGMYTDKTLLTPTKTQFTYEGTEGNLYLSATYYALFLPRSANLTVTITSGQKDTFILTFTGVADTFAEGTVFTVPVVDGVVATVSGVPIGQYVVAMDTAWSWRYDQIKDNEETTDVNEAIATVAVSVGGNYEIALTPKETQWLTDEVSATYSSANP